MSRRREKSMEPADWRAFRKQGQAARDSIESKNVDRLNRLVLAGTLRSERIGEYGYRITAPTAEGVKVDYWPRTNRWRVVGKQDAETGSGWIPLLTLLGVLDR